MPVITMIRSYIIANKAERIVIRGYSMLPLSDPAQRSSSPVWKVLGPSVWAPKYIIDTRLRAARNNENLRIGIKGRTRHHGFSVSACTMKAGRGDEG